MTEPRILASFDKPFRAQVAALRLRLANQVPTAKWTDLQRAAHERAFTVAGAVKADVLAALAEAVRKTIEEGGTLETFTKDFRRIVEETGWHGWTGEGTPKGEAWRIRTIYRTNMLTSYAAGRMAQLVDGNFKYWVYKHGNALEPRLQHLAWDGIALPPDHPFWAAHAPPNGWGCTCRIFGARTEDGIRRVGGIPGKNLPDGWDAINPKTGAPVGIDKGWDYPVGRSVAEEIAANLARIVARVPPEIGADLASSNASPIDAAWQSWMDRALVRRQSEPGLVGAFGQDVIRALADAGRPPVSSDLLVRPGLVAGPKAERHVQAGDALTEAQWRALPRMVRTPKAVYRDARTDKLVMILEVPAEGVGRAVQLAVEIDAMVERSKGDAPRPANLVTSAYAPRLADILGRVAGGLLVALFGGLG